MGLDWPTAATLIAALLATTVALLKLRPRQQQDDARQGIRDRLTKLEADRDNHRRELDGHEEKFRGIFETLERYFTKTRPGQR